MTAQNHPLGDGLAATEVERPASLDALQDVVKRRVAAGDALYPQGGGTSLDFGGVPRRPGVAVVVRDIKGVVDYPAADMTITVEAGMTLAELASVLDAAGQRLTIDAPQSDRATLGGVFASNASGPRRYGLGRPRDQIIGVSFVTSDGEVVKGGGRVVKNVAGYDFPRLITGSLGTLGIISQMTLKVRPKPEASSLVWFGVESTDDLPSVLDRINVSDVRPTAVELYNKPAAEAVGGALGLTVSTWNLAVGFEDNAASVAWQIDRFRAELGGRESLAVVGDSAVALWSKMVEYPAEAPGELAFEARLAPSATARFSASIDPGRWTVQAHAGSGVVRGFLRDRVERDEAARMIGELRTRAEATGGALVLPRCPADWKAELLVWGGRRPDWAWCERLKKTMDPAGALNPGRFVGAV